MNYLLTITFCIFLNACASTPNQTKPITISKVQYLNYGKITQNELETLFGKPANEYTFDINHKALIYNERVNNYQRASFNIENKTGKVISGLILLNSGDQKITTKDIPVLFTGANFVKNRVPQTNPHEFTDDYTLTDKYKGISIDVDAYYQTATSISFFQPEEHRSPATKKNSL